MKSAAIKRILRRMPHRSDFVALQDISFKVPKAKPSAWLGATVRQKHAFNFLMSRIYRPTSGTIKVVGRVATLLELGGGFFIPNSQVWKTFF